MENVHNLIKMLLIYNSIGLIMGFLICLIVEPGSEGLNGACAPYGLGTGSSDSSSGMYAFGRGSAVVVMPPDTVCKSTSSSIYEIREMIYLAADIDSISKQRKMYS